MPQKYLLTYDTCYKSIWDANFQKETVYFLETKVVEPQEVHDWAGEPPYHSKVFAETTIIKPGSIRWCCCL